ncbi:hypothetical protein FB567DRAFT_505194 [Paraphoma chrysanthemicola]|uniref:Uncharacterized protein n=1 Tax=Paraphoma chrysanthemicola TaxID=798071 RepID=A0A8K0QVS6_9PLEO|nr:hypothetical protein FB567DRAFT_505194 [Paraphoma chrysanthemicola]
MLTQYLLRDHALRTNAMLREQKSRVAALQKELQTLEASLAASTTEEHDAFDTLAKAECLQLCNSIMTYLPREIRDMVLRHLSTSAEEHVEREYFRSTLDPKTRMHTYDTERWKAKHHPEHFWDVEYVGPDFLRELIENHYRTSTFVFDCDGGLIERFLESDQLKAGFQPGVLVSRIEVRINAITFDRTSCRGYMFGCPIKAERLVAALAGIERLKSGASVVVHFSTMANTEKQKEEQILMACTAMCPGLREAKLAGKRVRLIINRKLEVELDAVDGDYRLKDLEADYS